MLCCVIPQVLRYLVRVVDHDMLANEAMLQSRLDLTLFHPPREPLKVDFYPDEVADIPEYREYFYSLKNKPDKIHRAYNNRSAAASPFPVFRPQLIAPSRVSRLVYQVPHAARRHAGPRVQRR